MTSHGSYLENKKKLLVSNCTHGSIYVILYKFSDKDYLSCEERNLGKNLKLLIWYKCQC